MKQPYLYRGQLNTKWMLYSGLVAALGFTVSFDPSNHSLARSQQLHVANLATTAAPQPEIKEVSAKTTSMQISGSNNETYQVNVAEIDGKAQATFFKLQTGTEAQGASCQLCGKTQVLSNNLTKIDQLKTELQTIVNNQPAATKVASPAAPQQPGKATTADLAEWAAKCAKKDESEKLSCHTQQLIKLSKHLANENAQASLVFEYYRENIYSDLRAGFRASPYSSMYQEVYNEAYETYLQIFEELRGKNGRTVRDNIVKLHAASYANQARHGQQLIIDGLNQTRPDLMNGGYALINRLNGLARQTQAFHQSAIYDIDGLSRMEQQSLFDTSRTQMDGVSRMIRDLLLARDIRNYQIPIVAGDNFPLSTRPGGAISGDVLSAPSADIARMEEILRARAAANGGRNSGMTNRQTGSYGPSSSPYYPSGIPTSQPGRNLRNGRATY